MSITEDDKQYPKNCSSLFLPPIANSFIKKGSNEYAGSLKMQIGTAS